MKKINILIVIFSILFYGCQTSGVGKQQINNFIIPMDDIYNVLIENFHDYKIYLERPRRSPSSNYYIFMTSDNFDILILYSGPTEKRTGIDISYHINGKNTDKRINELKDPMENIKQCLINNFPEYLSDDSFIETFYIIINNFFIYDI